MAPPPLPLPPPSSPPAALPKDLVEEVLLRFPLGEPASLLRAALVCKHWRHLVSGPGFRRRFREFHRAPAMLGLFCNSENSRFVPTTAFRPRHAERGHGRMMDARHGRVLLQGEDMALIVWDPITGDEWKVPFPLQRKGSFCWNAVVVCSAAAGAGGCDSLDCHCRPFIVVCVASVPKGLNVVETFIYTYSSNAAAWSEPICGQRPRYFVNSVIRSLLVGNTLYFGDLLERSIALKYNTCKLHQVSWIQLPSVLPFCRLCALTATENGGLQLSMEDGKQLCIWSTKDADEVDIRWEQNRVIDLNKLLPNDAKFILLFVVGSTYGLGTIFVSTDNVSYVIDLKTYKVEKVYEGTTNTIIPFMSFYTLELEGACTGEDPSAGGSST